MNSTLNRLNAVSALATSTILGLVAVIALLSYPVHKSSGQLGVQGLEVYVRQRVPLHSSHALVASVAGHNGI